MPSDSAVLDLRAVSVTYGSHAGPVRAVRDADLTIPRGAIVGLIGESGSGKSTLAHAIMRLLRGEARLTSGDISVDGVDVYALTPKQLRLFRWSRMSMVFQSAMTALSPVMTVEAQLVDVFTSHRRDMSRAQARKQALTLLDLVRIDRKHAASYPHELSGGMRQRVVIAIAIALEPALVIMDEPTTALDVVVQRSILEQIQELQRERQFAILFISHDFQLVSELASKVAIMYAGRIVEVTESRHFDHSEGHHPYTQGLMRAIPRLTDENVVIEGIPGNPPDISQLPAGCSFHPRCSQALEICRTTRPEPRRTALGEVACHLFPLQGGDSQ